MRNLRVIYFFLAVSFFKFTAIAQNSRKSSLDSRAAAYYSEKEIEKMMLVAPYKIEQINFLYSKSFRIINQDGRPIKTDASKFDIYNYERFRKQNERAVFRLTREGDALELLSREEVDQAYISIQNSYIPN